MYDENDIAHVELANPIPEEPVKRIKKKQKDHGVLKSAVNGLVFGLCASLVICLVMVVANRTFLKQEDSQTQEAWNEDVESEEQENTAENDAKGSAEAEANVNERENFQGVSKVTGNTGLSVEEIAKNCMPSVVSITTVGVEEVRSMFGTQKYESQGAGSGIIIGENETELLVATNNHVVSSAEEVSVCFDDDSEDAVVSAKVKGTDPANDLAIVAVLKEDIPKEVKNTIKIASIGDSDSLHIGEQVVAIGNALGYGQSVTTGIVSALDRSVNIESYSAKLIQTDAAINPGNSGGALLNMKGELIGINSAKFASQEVEGMGYAIPIATAQPILDNLMNRETRDVVSKEEAGFLGVSVQDVSEEAAELYDIPKGAYIGSVENGAAADKAGLKKGDIITQFDGLAITSASSLRSNIAYYKAGEEVEVVYMRSNNGAYEEKKVTVTLAKSKNIDQANNEEKEQDKQTEKAESEWVVPGQDEDNGTGSFDDFFGNGSIRDFFEQFAQ